MLMWFVPCVQGHGGSFYCVLKAVIVVACGMHARARMAGLAAQQRKLAFWALVKQLQTAVISRRNVDSRRRLDWSAFLKECLFITLISKRYGAYGLKCYILQ